MFRQNKLGHFQEIKEISILFGIPLLFVMFKQNKLDRFQEIREINGFM
jgi:hypothetical protein